MGASCLIANCQRWAGSRLRIYKSPCPQAPATNSYILPYLSKSDKDLLAKIGIQTKAPQSIDDVGLFAFVEQ